MIQELWQKSIEWDQTLPADLEHRANKWINSVKYLSKIEVLRYYGINMSVKKPELHILLTQYVFQPICFGRDLLKSIYQHFKREKNGTRLLETSLLMTSCQLRTKTYQGLFSLQLALSMQLIEWTCHSDIESSLGREDVTLDERNYKRHFWYI